MMARRALQARVAFAVHLQAHHHVLRGGQTFMQVMRLKDEPELAAQCDQHRLGRVAQFLIQQMHAALLHIAQASDQRQKRGFARAGWPHEDRQTTFADVKVNVPNRLFTRFAVAEIMV